MNDPESRTKARATPGQGIGVWLKCFGLICIIAGVVWGIATYDFSSGRLFAGPAGWLFLGGICCQLVGGGTISRADRRDWERVRLARFRLCLRCRYSLVDLEPDGVCPECGERYTAKGLKEGWRRTHPVLAVLNEMKQGDGEA